MVDAPKGSVSPSSPNSTSRRMASARSMAGSLVAIHLSTSAICSALKSDPRNPADCVNACFALAALIGVGRAATVLHDLPPQSLPCGSDQHTAAAQIAEAGGSAHLRYPRSHWRRQE